MTSLHQVSKISQSIGFNMPKVLWVALLFFNLLTQGYIGMQCETDMESLTFKKHYWRISYIYIVCLDQIYPQLLFNCSHVATTFPSFTTDGNQQKKEPFKRQNGRAES